MKIEKMRFDVISLDGIPTADDECLADLENKLNRTAYRKSKLQMCTTMIVHQSLFFIAVLMLFLKRSLRNSTHLHHDF